MSDGEGVLWVGVDLVVLSVEGLVDTESELILLLGSVGDTVGRQMLDEVVLEQGEVSSRLAERAGETHVGSSSAEGVHLN